MFVMVLNDGETYTNLIGCAILGVDTDMVNRYSGRDNLDEAIKDFMSGQGVTGINLVTQFVSHIEV